MLDQAADVDCDSQQQLLSWTAHEGVLYDVVLNGTFGVSLLLPGWLMGNFRMIILVLVGDMR